MTRILNETKTYSLIDGHMVHTGYFIVSNNYRLKQVFKSAWDDVKSRPAFKLNLDHAIGHLQDAQ